MYVFIISSNEKIRHAMTFDYDSIQECAEEIINNWNNYAMYWESHDGNLTDILFDAINGDEEMEITYRDITENEYDDFIDSITSEMLIIAIQNSKNHLATQDFYKLTESRIHIGRNAAQTPLQKD